jgi:hypothetical protein
MCCAPNETCGITRKYNEATESEGNKRRGEMSSCTRNETCAALQEHAMRSESLKAQQKQDVVMRNEIRVCGIMGDPNRLESMTVGHSK